VRGNGGVRRRAGRHFGEVNHLPENEKRVGVVRSDTTAPTAAAAQPNLPQKTLSAEAARVALIRGAVPWYGSWGAHTSAGEAYTHVSKTACTCARCGAVSSRSLTAGATTLLFCPPHANDRWSQNAWALAQQSDAAAPAYSFSCASQWVALNASLEPLEQWWARLVVALLRRRDATVSERDRLRARHGSRIHANHPYHTLALGLENALQDELFPRTGLWLDFGVFRALSTNITSLYVPDRVVVDGFDSFVGLPEPWHKRALPGGGGPLNLYFGKGAFSWAEYAATHGFGALPPVLPRVALHRGLFAETLPRFLAAQPSSRPVAWASIDCDLYHGTRDVLASLAPRLALGTRLHFHELLKLPDLGRATRWLESTGEHGASAAKRPRAKRAHHSDGAIPPSDEARALWEWLRSEPSVLLELDATHSARKREPALLVVRRTSLGAGTRGRAHSSK
jgi:hypothetical protein